MKKTIVNLLAVVSLAFGLSFNAEAQASRCIVVEAYQANNPMSIIDTTGNGDHLLFSKKTSVPTVSAYQETWTPTLVQGKQPLTVTTWLGSVRTIASPFFPTMETAIPNYGSVMIPKFWGDYTFSPSMKFYGDVFIKLNFDYPYSNLSSGSGLGGVPITSVALVVSTMAGTSFYPVTDIPEGATEVTYRVRLASLYFTVQRL